MPSDDSADVIRQPGHRGEVHTVNVERVGGGLVYLVSDIHLGDGSHSDIFQHKDDAFLAFLDEVEERAQTLVIVGDALDFDQAWYFSRILRAHRAVISRLTRLTETVPVVYVYGNHDPDIVLFRDILRWKLCDKVILDGHMLAVHGYEFDSYVGDDFEGSTFWARVMMGYETLFKTWIRLPLRDYYTLSNRLAHYLFFWMARAARLMRKHGPRLGRPDLGRGISDFVNFWTKGVLGDPMGLTRPVLAQLDEDPTYDTVICGHSHIPGVVGAEGGGRYINLGSWSFGNSQYGIWDGERFRLRDWISGREFGDENYRHIIEGYADWSFEQWFEDEYMGYLRFRGGEEALRCGVRPRPWAAGKPRPAMSHVERVDTHRLPARQDVAAVSAKVASE